jgi:hypothetical protein
MQPEAGSSESVKGRSHETRYKCGGDNLFFQGNQTFYSREDDFVDLSSLL